MISSIICCTNSMSQDTRWVVNWLCKNTWCSPPPWSSGPVTRRVTHCCDCGRTKLRAYCNSPVRWHGSQCCWSNSSNEYIAPRCLANEPPEGALTRLSSLCPPTPFVMTLLCSSRNNLFAVPSGSLEAVPVQKLICHVIYANTTLDTVRIHVHRCDRQGLGNLIRHYTMSATRCPVCIAVMLLRLMRLAQMTVWCCL
ncbi:hypothetical protein BJY52DRAFT_1267271 [Lactarius psammicola]|nr:hypothetical protein BJY52DRAFT_1267271 [Lactarius psammicola]